jgi:hypothetical protein
VKFEHFQKKQKKNPNQNLETKINQKKVTDYGPADNTKEGMCGDRLSWYGHGICYGVAKLRWFLYGRRRYPDAGLVHSTR